MCEVSGLINSKPFRKRCVTIRRAPPPLKNWSKFTQIRTFFRYPMKYQISPYVDGFLLLSRIFFARNEIIILMSKKKLWITWWLILSSPKTSSLPFNGEYMAVQFVIMYRFFVKKWLLPILAHRNNVLSEIKTKWFHHMISLFIAFIRQKSRYH